MGSLLIAGIMALVFLGMCSAVGAYVSIAKGRNPVEGAFLSFSLGPLGILIAALLPTQAKTTDEELDLYEEDDKVDRSARGFLDSL